MNLRVTREDCQGYDNGFSPVQFGKQFSVRQICVLEISSDSVSLGRGEYGIHNNG